MKKASTVMTLPIVGIKEGAELGKVRSMIVDPKRQAVSYFFCVMRIATYYHC